MTRYLVSVRWRAPGHAFDHLYLIEGELEPGQMQELAGLLHDRVVQDVAWVALDALAEDPFAPRPGASVIEVAYRPGVTDNEAESVRIGAARLGISGVHAVKTVRRYDLHGRGEADNRAFFNPLIETTLRYDAATAHRRAAWYDELLRPPADSVAQIAHVAIVDAGDEELMRISREGVLSLDLDEMRAIQGYFRAEEREPSDGELETLAQTWSEHCSHKTFKANVRYRGQEPHAPGTAELPDELYRALRMLDGDCAIDSLIGTFLVSATNEILARRVAAGDSRPQLEVLSAFVDNAGILAFDDDYEISFKVETHNHPSALEPFGGANTGVGGVVRDILGVSAQPIANTDVLCFGPLDLPEQQLADGVLHPRQVAAGVVAGVRDYGNKLGIPTVNGAVLYDPGYVANPLVFCGTVGLAPRGRHPRGAQPGDLVVVLGGRTGRDGIHGATFSSVELTHTTAQDVGSAVQIGDPITEKKVLDVILQARDAGLYRAITDCGAGGLSSAVGEMGEETGVAVELEQVPLKYAGLQPWEIWLSEAQERMVIAVAPEHRAALLELCAAEDVEATVIGRFTGDGRLTVTHRGAPVVDLAMRFLHGGRPQRTLEALWRAEARVGAAVLSGEAGPAALDGALMRLLAHPNIASKAAIVRTYDHEVQGRTVVKPLVGATSEGPGDAAVLQPLRASLKGVAIGCGVNPRYGLIDPYWMALACVDEALRNVVAVGADPAQAAILDNFCWGDPRLPDRMAGLVRAAAGCYDAALAFGAPFVSGKDSLNNEYRAADGTRTPHPPTQLVTARALGPDVRRSVTMDLKQPGSAIYLVGVTRDELAGSHYAEVQGRPAGETGVPKVDLALAPRLFAALHGAIGSGLVRACHDLSEGGLGVALAEMAIAGDLGARIELKRMPQHGSQDEATLLFSESPSRFLVEVAPEHTRAFEAALAGLPVAPIGVVERKRELVIDGLESAEIVRAAVSELKAAWQGTVVV
jgi:phosphoribosylformylglycinamidine synthase